MSFLGNKLQTTELEGHRHYLLLMKATNTGHAKYKRIRISYSGRKMKDCQIYVKVTMWLFQCACSKTCYKVHAENICFDILQSAISDIEGILGTTIQNADEAEEETEDSTESK